MLIKQYLDQLEQTYEVIAIIDLDPWFDVPVYQKNIWLEKKVNEAYRSEYSNNERIVFTLSQGDIYDSETAPAGLLITNLFKQLNKVDISNFFVILLTNDSQHIPAAVKWTQDNISKDPVSITCVCYADKITSKKLVPKMAGSLDYNSTVPIKIGLDQLDQREKYLLTQSKTFCMYPWIHLHAYPTGQAYPCCHAEMQHPVGNCKEKTIKEIWNDTPLRGVRHKMLSEQPVDACIRCYEQEDAGFFSGRQSANKHHGHHINLVKNTQEDGTAYDFRMIYWDIRFSNLCNLRCRSCGHIFSSQWYNDQVELAGPEWGKRNQVLNYAGKNKTDMWEQLVEHIDYVEQIYFAGGEPLMMEEHYNILDELERRDRFDVRLIYNTNFTHVKLKERTVFDYWKRFKSVSVGASLDAMGPRAEYIRKGTDWNQVERNRHQMMEICPRVDFYISPTLSIMNACHLPNFHRAWTDAGLIKAQDLNVNILQDPAYYRIDVANASYKDQVREQFERHLEWLRPQDPLKRATVGFESAIKFMDATDNSHLLPKFWSRTQELDNLRRENIFDALPELRALK